MFLNIILSFNTYSHEIKFINSRQQDSKTDLTMHAMKSIKAYYEKRGFDIVELRSDQKFEPARAAFSNMDIELNASVRNDHVPDIECLNRTMKERIR